MKRIGIVGLGHMGLPMAINLVKAGFEVTGFDTQPAAMEQFVSAGGLAAANLQELAASKDTLLTMLQTGDQVLGVCLGEHGLFRHATKNTLFIDCSSIDVKRSRQYHEHANSFGFLSVDAPVSGGVAGAAQARLTFMVGGTDEAFEKAKPILSNMGKKIIHTGIAGSGQAAKICKHDSWHFHDCRVRSVFISRRIGVNASETLRGRDKLIRTMLGHEPLSACRWGIR